MQMRETDAQRGAVISAVTEQGPEPSTGCQAWGMKAGTELGKGGCEQGRGQVGSWPFEPPYFMSEHLLARNLAAYASRRLTESGPLVRSSSCRGSSRGACERHGVWARLPTCACFGQVPGRSTPWSTGHTHLAFELVDELLEAVDLEPPLHLSL